MALIALALAPVAASAVNQQIAVIPLAAPAMLMFSGRGLSEAIAEEAKKIGTFTVLGPRDLDRLLSRDDLARLIDCGVDPGCILTQSAQLKVDRIVAGVLGRTDANYRVHLVQVDVAKAAVIASLQREIPIASRRLKPDVLAATPALLRGEAEATGTLMVTTEKPDATVYVDDEPAGQTPVKQIVKPGTHKVAVVQEGFIQQEPHYLDVPPGGVVEDKVKQYPVPGTGLAPSSQTTISISKPLPLWPGLASAALGGVALAWGGMKGQQVEAFNAKVADRNGDGRFDVTRRAALMNQSNSRLANGLLIGGGVAMALGVVFITMHAIDAGPPSAEVVLTSGSATLAGSF